MKYPIFDHRTVVGYASTLKGAAQKIKSIVHVDKRAKMHVWQRDTSIIDLPAGFVFAISWGTK